MIGRLTIATVCAVSLCTSVHAADPEQGRSIYETHCGMCHGDDGRGMVPGAPDFGRGQGLFVADTDIVRKLRAGFGGMPAYEGLLREQQLLDVVAFIRTFHR